MSLPSGPTLPPPPSPGLALHWQILIAMAAALLLPAILPKLALPASIDIIAICKLGGGLFLNALKMLVIPLVGSSLVVAIMSIGRAKDFGRLSARLGTWVIGTSLIAAIIGMVVVNLIQPGVGADLSQLHIHEVPAAAQNGGAKIVQTLLSIVPANPLAAAASDQMLGVVFFSLLFGFFAARLPEQQATLVADGAGAVFATMIGMARWILRFAPLGVFFLALDALLQYGFGMLVQLGAYIVAVLIGLAFHALVVLPLLLRGVSGVKPLALFRVVAPAVLTAFSTASSKAALPITLDALETGFGVQKRISRFVLPLATTVNMNGSALYESVAAIFIAQLYGIELGISGQIVIVLVALLTTLGLSGMPGAGVIGLATVLAAAGLPIEGLALVLAVDRVLDMARTAVNVWSDACVTAAIAQGADPSDVPDEDEDRNVADTASADDSAAASRVV